MKQFFAKILLPPKKGAAVKPSLHLCAKDIKVGDTVVSKLNSNESGIIGGFKSTKTFWFEGDEPVATNFHSVENWGKVIGRIDELSLPWVKNGQEFDIENIAEVSDAGDDVCFLLRADWNDEWEGVGNAEFCRFAIKGPCGHFHPPLYITNF